MDNREEVREAVAREIGRYRLIHGPDGVRLFKDERCIEGPWGYHDIDAAEAALRRAQADAALSALPVQEPPGWRPTHRHVKRGTEYEVFGTARFQTVDLDQSLDDEPVTIYRGKDGQWWARPSAEFDDGRFAPLPPVGSQRGQP